tara:strand:+ start:17135 stop:17341 length:207 start_codon:yes stop_codon:yes gene_type:complete
MSKSKLTPLKKFVKEKFGDDVSMRTAQHWCQNGHITCAEKIGRQWFVDVEAFENRTGNELVDRILMAS